jgi:hypothetical protein
MEIKYLPFALPCLMMNAQGGGDMPNASDTQGMLRQNLIDAGCGTDAVQTCMALAQEKKTAELMRVLSQHRRALLDTLHRSEKRIDCLDYLLYTLEKQEKPK